MFEPQAVNVRMLTASYSINGWDECIPKIIPAAVGDRKISNSDDSGEKLKLWIHAGNNGGSMLMPANDARGAGGTAIEMVRFDDIFAPPTSAVPSPPLSPSSVGGGNGGGIAVSGERGGEGYLHINFMKMDAQGYELMALKGGEKVFGRSRKENGNADDYDDQGGVDMIQFEFEPPTMRLANANPRLLLQWYYEHNYKIKAFQVRGGICEVVAVHRRMFKPGYRWGCEGLCKTVKEFTGNDYLFLLRDVYLQYSYSDLVHFEGEAGAAAWKKKWEEETEEENLW